MTGDELARWLNGGSLVLNGITIVVYYFAYRTWREFQQYRSCADGEVRKFPHKGWVYFHLILFAFNLSAVLL